MDLQISTRVALFCIFQALYRWKSIIFLSAGYYVSKWLRKVTLLIFAPRLSGFPNLHLTKHASGYVSHALCCVCLLKTKVIPYMYGSHELFPTQLEPQGFKQALPAYVPSGLSGERCVNISYTYTAGIRAVLSNSIVEEKGHYGRFNRVLVLQMESSDRY